MRIAYDVAWGLHDADLGNVPTWIGTVITSTSLAVATTSFLRSQRDKKREHASKIGAWIASEDGEYYVHVANTNSAPAYDLVVTDPDTRDQLAKIQELPANQHVRAPVEKVDGSKWEPRLKLGELELTVVGGELEFSAPEQGVNIEFRDGLGRRWAIDARGGITRLKTSSYKMTDDGEEKTNDQEGEGSRE